MNLRTVICAILAFAITCGASVSAAPAKRGGGQRLEIWKNLPKPSVKQDQNAGPSNAKGVMASCGLYQICQSAFDPKGKQTFTISQPGVYTVIEDLIFAGTTRGQYAIVVACDDVTIDFGNHTLTYGTGGTNAIGAVGQKQVTIMNGTIKDTKEFTPVPYLFWNVAPAISFPGGLPAYWILEQGAQSIIEFYRAGDLYGTGDPNTDLLKLTVVDTSGPQPTISDAGNKSGVFN